MATIPQPRTRNFSLRGPTCRTSLAVAHGRGQASTLSTQDRRGGVCRRAGPVLHSPGPPASPRPRGPRRRDGVPVREIRDLLEGELHTLEHEFRIELPREIRTAVAMGDLRENAEYHAALERQTYVRARIGQLRQRLAEVNTINLQSVPRDRAGLGSRVTLLNLDTDEELVYRARVSRGRGSRLRLDLDRLPDRAESRGPRARRRGARQDPDGREALRGPGPAHAARQRRSVRGLTPPALKRWGPVSAAPASTGSSRRRASSRSRCRRSSSARCARDTTRRPHGSALRRAPRAPASRR